MKIYHLLGFKLFLGVAVIVLTCTSIFATFYVEWQAGRILETTVHSAATLSDVINRSTRHGMLLNRREDIYEIIKTIGHERNIEGIRIFSKKGEIIHSTNPEEIGHRVDMNAESCVGCHTGAGLVAPQDTSTLTRIFSSPKGYRVLGVITPIRNDQSCSSASCHAHAGSQSVLGILDVIVSLKDADENVASLQHTLLGSAVGLVIILTTFVSIFIWRTVNIPVGKLDRGTEEIVKGNLNHRIDIRTHDEIGRLAHSFNQMSEELLRARTELTGWTQTLEERVAQKTEELRRAQAHLVQIEKMVSLGTLAATVAHELNNPREGILTYAKLVRKRMQQGQVAPETVREMIDEMSMIADETARCGNIVKNLLLFSKEKVGDFKATDLRSVIQQGLKLIDHHMKMHNIRVTALLGDAPVMLLCDGHQIEEALLALEINAVEAMPEGGDFRLEVTGDPTAKDVVITVADTGCGIPADVLPHIFEPFFTTKKDGKGTGLGLSVVYGIVQRHSGTIAVDSTPGRGTTFTLTLPRHPEPARPAGESSLNPSSPGAA